MRQSSWSQRLLADGEDPDPRVSLANERTFLAWIRTALGLMAVGIGVATFAPTELDPRLAWVIAAGLIIVGGAVATASWFRWLSVERAMRRREGVPATRILPLMALAITVLAVLSVISVVAAP